MDSNKKQSFESLVKEYLQSLYLNKNTNRNFIRMCYKMQSFLSKNLKR